MKSGDIASPSITETRVQEITLTNHNPESHLALPVNQEKSSSIAFKFCRNDCFKTTSDAFREQKVRDVGMC